jgi:hypothetical protein
MAGLSAQPGTNRKKLLVSGFAESPGFKPLDFLSGRFAKSEYQKLFLFGSGSSGL